jgi:hypothetical protein
MPGIANSPLIAPRKTRLEKFRCKNERPVILLWLELWAVFFKQ